MKFCALTAVALGLGPGADLAIAQALSTKPRLPVLWINGLSCSCCTESFLRTAHPLATDIVLSMITMDYQDTIMAAAGDQANEAYEEAIKKYKGQYILAVEGNVPLNGQGMYCIDGGKPFYEKLKEGVEHAKALVAWGTCASWGCVQAANPNPTGATPLHKLFPNKPQIKVPGCPAIPEVMSSILTYIITYDRLPTLDSQGRPEMFYGKRVHDHCYRRPILTRANMWNRGTMRALALACACTKWAAKAPPPTMPAPPPAGTTAFPSPFSLATAASAVRNRTSGIRDRFMTA